LLASGHAPWEVWNLPAAKKENSAPRRDTKERSQKPRGRARLRDGRA